MTEMGRQPWIVQGLLRTADGVSPRVGTAQVALSLGGFLALFSRPRRHRAVAVPARGAARAATADDPRDARAREAELSLAY